MGPSPHNPHLGPRSQSSQATASPGSAVSAEPRACDDHQAEVSAVTPQKERPSSPSGRSCTAPVGGGVQSVATRTQRRGGAGQETCATSKALLHYVMKHGKEKKFVVVTYIPSCSP